MKQRILEHEMKQIDNTLISLLRFLFTEHLGFGIFANRGIVPIL
jgi:hypothetical protein